MKHFAYKSRCVDSAVGNLMVSAFSLSRHRWPFVVLTLSKHPMYTFPRSCLSFSASMRNKRLVLVRKDDAEGWRRSTEQPSLFYKHCVACQRPSFSCALATSGISSDQFNVVGVNGRLTSTKPLKWIILRCENWKQSEAYRKVKSLSNNPNPFVFERFLLRSLTLALN